MVHRMMQMSLTVSRQASLPVYLTLPHATLMWLLSLSVSGFEVGHPLQQCYSMVCRWEGGGWWHRIANESDFWIWSVC